MGKPACRRQILPLTSFPFHHLLFYTCIFFSSCAHSSPDTFLYVGCSPIKFTPASQYESNLNSLLTSLVNSATYSPYNKYTIMGSSPQDVVYGLYQCRADLAMPDCATCVARAVARLGPLCSGKSCGGSIQLEGCFVKYDNASFIGVEDKAVAMKKCGPSDGDVTASGRDAVLQGLLYGSGGAYRVGGSEAVQGVAQCVGDMSTGQCQDCLGEAVRQLKAECGGGAVFGDMFLGKCYVRYSTSGASAYRRPNHDSFHNQSEKTFAIIIGLLAGVALVIIFLTFMRRIFGGNGK